MKRFVLITQILMVFKWGQTVGGWCKKSSVLILKNDDHDHHDESVTMWYRMNDYGNCK